MEELIKRLNGFQVRVYQTDDGFAAVSDSEPAFCFLRETAAELTSLVADTLRSYCGLFHGIAP